MIANNISRATQSVQPPDIYDRAFFRLIKEVAIHILFPFGVMWMVSSLLPISFHAVVLAGAVIGAAFIASFFYQPDDLHSPPPVREPVSFLGPSNNVQIQEIENGAVPPNYPRGIFNPSNQCGINSAAQAIRLSPTLNRWIRTEDQNPLFQPFRDFYNQYERDLGRRVTTASSQPLRVVFSQISPSILPYMYQQIDPADALIAFCRYLPQDLLGIRQEIKYWDTSNLGPILNNPQGATTGQAELFNNIEIALPQHSDRLPNDSISIEQLLASYWNDQVSPGAWANQFNMNRQVVPYPLLRTERSVIRPPRVLIVNIKRYQNVLVGAPSRFSQIPLLNLFAHKQQAVMLENETPVEIQNEIEIPVIGGQARYRLTSFITHSGSPRGGHYVADGIEGENRYHFNDSHVTRLEINEWENRKARANVLIFELVQE